MLGILGLALNPQAWVAAGIVALLSFGSGYFKGRESVDVVGIQQTAFAKGQKNRDGEWKTKMDEAELQAQAAIGAALEIGRAEPLPDADVASLCKTDNSCRDR